MFKVYFYNFGYYSANEGSSLDEAKAIAKKAYFQATIIDPNGERVLCFCPIRGFHKPGY